MYIAFIYREYASLCGEKFIHHNPEGEYDDKEIKKGRYERTLLEYSKAFGVPDDDDDHDLWPSVSEEFPENVSRAHSSSGGGKC